MAKQLEKFGDYYFLSVWEDLQRAPQANMMWTAGGAPTTYTRLYLYPVQTVVSKGKNVEELLNAYGYFMPIPVSPASLEYGRSADHREAYSITNGGMLQRNLPGLWTLSVESYIPKDIYERAFHNWSQDKKWDGVSTQQSFVDYINTLMRFKVPFALYDSSSPERIKHNAEFWCIKAFSYKMNPHDDIDYKLELIEWKEPKVRTGELVMTERTPTTSGTPGKPTIRGGNGKAIMAFGIKDPRNYDGARVWHPELIGVFRRIAGEKYGILDLAKFNQAFKQAEPWNDEVHTAPNYTVTVQYRRVMNAPRDAIVVPIVVRYGIAAATHIQKTIKSIVRNEAIGIRRSVEARYVKLPNNGMFQNPFGTTQAQSNVITNDGGGYVREMTQFYKDTAQRLIDTKLNHNAWCEKLKVLNNMGMYYIEQSVGDRGIEPVGANYEWIWMVEMRLKHVVWQPECYVLRPIVKGTNVDVWYRANQSWLVPKQNTIETSYKEYFATVEGIYPSASALSAPGEEVGYIPKGDGTVERLTQTLSEGKVTDLVKTEQLDNETDANVDRTGRTSGVFAFTEETINKYVKGDAYPQSDKQLQP